MNKNSIFNRLVALGFEPFKYKPTWGQTRWRVKYKCVVCGKDGECDFGKVLYKKFTRKCFECSRVFRNIGEKHLSWKGGTYTHNGYTYTRVYDDDKFYSMVNSNGYVKRSRYNMAKKLDRPLDRKEVVHHINGIKSDDSLENLELFNDTAKHSSVEYSNRRVDILGRFSR